MMQSVSFRDDDSLAGLSTADSLATGTPSDASASHPQLRPILVGYAFGPKKMSTMGIIMAEASKAQLSSMITAEIPVTIETRPSNNLNSDEEPPASESRRRSRHIPLTSAALARAQSPRTQREGVTFSIWGGPNAGLRNIVRHFRSSCSSVATSEDTSTTATATTGPMLSSSTSSSRRQHPVRVSFVPLDMDTPLEEQHGGQIDVILHKLTEDILCLSTMQQNQQTDDAGLEETHAQALARVNRLNEYERNHPQCCLIDHPANVQVVMSRSDIAEVLQQSLVGVTSASGIPVRTPRFQIMNRSDAASETYLPLPLIAKPLQAAGTKKSHRMGVVLHPSGLDKVNTPCLLQEYANHDATLFKVYVLGDHVSVFERPSLPNLPSDSSQIHDYVEFDSQRPYPILEDFGYDVSTNEPSTKRQKTHHVTRQVTVEEIRPVAHVLARAFGLELFGFDILVTNSPETELLVVDVNYFPSYKEVSNFPSLLANYLTQRAIEGRVKRPAGRD